MTEQEVSGAISAARTADAAGLWDQRRRDLLDALIEVNDTVGAVYRTAVDALSRRPGDKASLVVASHCVREIANALPDVLGDVDELPPYSNTGTAAQRLEKAWSDHADHLGDPDIPLSSSGASQEGSVNTVSVPAPVLESARLVVVAARAGRDNGQLRRSALVLGRLEKGQDPSVALFKKSFDFFMKFAHLNGALAKELPEDEEVLRHLKIFEDVVLSRVGRFFATAEEIFDILAAANTRSGS
jgi:hypothetical protein